MTADHPPSTVTRDGRVARIVLDRPARLNAFTLAAIHHLAALVEEVAASEQVRLVTLAGNGRAFSTGVDLKALPEDGFGVERMEAWEGLLRRIETMDKLVLAFIHGHAVGGGLQLALACDIRVATRSAQLGLPASKEGIIPGLSTWRLARYVGLGRAKQLIYLGQLIDAGHAERIGLVDHLLDDGGAPAAFEALVARYGASFSAGARAAKPLLGEAFHTDFETFMARYKTQQTRAVSSPDFEEAKAAYREGRDANWR